MPDWLKIAIVGAVSLFIFVIDAVLPINLAIPLFFVLPMLLAYQVGWQRGFQVLAGILIVLTIIGGMLSPVGRDALIGAAMINRVFISVVLIVLAYALDGRAKAEAALRGEATMDPLTGIANRRHCDQWLANEFERARRYGTPLTIGILDIDHFKRVNDTYGHPVGDVAIQTLANECVKQIRPFDLAARIGGEEFVLGLPQTPGDAAMVLAERLRLAVQAVAIDTKIGTLSFTISVGIAEASDGDEDAKAVLGRADKALYEAKQGGRNQVRFSIPEAAELSILDPNKPEKKEAAADGRH